MKDQTSNRDTEPPPVQTGAAEHGTAAGLLERLIMVTLQAAALQESLKELIEACVADNEAAGTT